MDSAGGAVRQDSLDKKMLLKLIAERSSFISIREKTAKTNATLSEVWKNFKCIFYKDLEQAFVQCNRCHDLLSHVPKSGGTSSLSNHTRRCDKLKTSKSTQPSVATRLIRKPTQAKIDDFLLRRNSQKTYCHSSVWREKDSEKWRRHS